MNLAQRLKKARKHARLSQSALAAAVDIQQPMISQLETGVSLSTSNIVKIAQVCGVNPLWLSEGIGDMFADSSHGNLIPVPLSGDWPMLSWESIGRVRDVSELELLPPVELVLGPPRPKGGFALQVQTLAMTSRTPGEKSYPLGCTIYIDPTRKPTEGSRIVTSAPLTGKSDFKTFSTDGDQRLMIPINDQYKSYVMTPDMVILGTVIGTFTPE